MSRLWFCSKACREAADSTPRPWPFAVHNDRCVMCHAPKPNVDAFLIAKADMSNGYYCFTAEPLIIVGDYVIVRVDAAWKHAAWEHISSGLQLGAAEIYDRVAEALAAAQELAACRPTPRPFTWEAIARGVDGDLVLARSAHGALPLHATTFTFRPTNPKWGIRRGSALDFSELRSSVGDAFPGRFRAALANAWVSLGLA
ncbi:hypothetical protein K2Z83_15620 [Oscillochloris sp. ZM17-4]|uniref:hypothetical protein n=1 Tax=Oscillochloris sp. ZM17-4 TaxID=2866714 RepID=UPI001C729F1D|nr:hypothetical protein [Oscillochloris sp. ZM17-4]MBX0329106.1 hypothetical protein [Oscillochloris sp. ZM17-4]